MTMWGVTSPLFTCRDRRKLAQQREHINRSETLHTDTSRTYHISPASLTCLKASEATHLYYNRNHVDQQGPDFHR